MAPSIYGDVQCPVFVKRANDALNLNPPVAEYLPSPPLSLFGNANIPQ